MDTLLGQWSAQIVDPFCTHCCFETEIELHSTHIPHTHSAHTLHTHSGHASSCGNQNDDVKIFVHWACRFHFEPNGSISLHLFLYLHQLRLMRGFHLQQVSWAWLSVWLPARPSRISMALIVMGHWSAQPAAHWVDVFAGFGPRWWLLR